MSSIETMARLGPSTSSYSAYAGVCTTVDKLAPLELAFLLSGLNKIEHDLFYAKYLLDMASEDSVVYHVQVYAVGLAVNEGWKVVKGKKTICNLSKFAVYEMVSDGRCRHCGGNGVDENIKVCKRCSGSGIYHIPGRKIEAGIGVNHSQWLRHWSDRYNRLISYMQTIDSNINIHVSRKRVR